MPKIAPAQLEEIFRGMRTQSGWDTTRPLLWGYFFTDPDESRLGPIAEHLTRQGYRVVNIYPTDDRSKTFLHVEKVEVHTPRSLHARNIELEALAAQFGISPTTAWTSAPSTPIQRTDEPSATLEGPRRPPNKRMRLTKPAQGWSFAADPRC